MDKLKECVEIARHNTAADLVLKNGNAVNVFTGEIENKDIAIAGNVIAGVGYYSGKKEIDCSGLFIVPGLIDAHVHIESSKVIPEIFSRAVIKKGVTCCIADPHEIANVLGEEGIRFMLSSGRRSAIDIFYMLPSCVPAADCEDNGAVIDAASLERFMHEKAVLGLGEVMDVPSAVNLNPGMKDKLSLFTDMIIDGHCPEISSSNLNAYLCCGIKTDHESVSADEAIDKVRRGMYVMIREGSAAKNLKDLIPAVNDDNFRRFLYCTDDKDIADILREGSIDFNIRKSVELGMDPVKAVIIATYNAAQCYGLKGRGALAPGYRADMVILNSLKSFDINGVIKDGKVYRETDYYCPNYTLKSSMNLDHIDEGVFRIKSLSKMVNVISIVKGSIVTKKVLREVESCRGYISNVKNSDALKIAVFERHKNTGKFSAGFIENLGLAGCSIAQSISHDSHNIVVCGDSDSDMALAVNRVIDMGGGISLASGGNIIGEICLPFGGLMTSMNPGDAAERINKIEDALKAHQSDSDINIPIVLSFMSLTVVPELKINARGLYDYRLQKFISLYDD